MDDSKNETLTQGEQARDLAFQMVKGQQGGGNKEQSMVAEAVAMGTIAALAVRDKSRN